MATTQLNLGRVIGAGFFTTSVATSTSVAISDIRPDTVKPLPGDSIVFLSNGDVRLIMSTDDTTVRCSDVIANISGEDGRDGVDGQDAQGLLGIELIDGHLFVKTNSAEDMEFAITDEGEFTINY